MKKIERQKIEFEKSLELRNFEIENFWRRGWFFGALILSIITAYYYIRTNKPPLIPPICISFIALVISICQSLMNRGSKYWQERWENKTKNRESSLGIDLTNTKKFNNNEKYYIDACIISKKESFLTRCQRFSVSKLTFLVWDIIAISCLMLWLNDILCYFPQDIKSWISLPVKTIIFHIVLLIYISIFCFWKGEMFAKISTSKKNDFEERLEKEHFLKECEDYITNNTKELKKKYKEDNNKIKKSK